MREIAAAAVTALGLDFGAVDLAQRPDGTLFVLEVNRAPGVEAGTAVAYAQAIQRWLNPVSMEEAA
jgi:glutathione synthase/RimK-type ligase-like ATP-grasp enzyme